MAPHGASARQQHQHQHLGADTFRGAASSDGTLRAGLYCKTLGRAGVDSSGLRMRVDSPVSGSLLTAPAGSGPQHHAALKDPITGTVLKLSGQQAQVVTPVLRQGQVHSRQFFLTNDVDITIATLRSNTGVSDKTNEKVGTAGTSTGLDRALVVGGQLRCTERKMQR